MVAGAEEIIGQSSCTLEFMFTKQCVPSNCSGNHINLSCFEGWSPSHGCFGISETLLAYVITTWL